MKKIIVTIMALILMLSLTACYASQPAGDTNDKSGSTANGSMSTGTAYSIESGLFDEDDVDSSWSIPESTVITLNGDSVSQAGRGVLIDDSIITITSAGTYLISGTLDDGQIVVSTGDKGAVRLVLNGVDITCSTSAPVYVASADKVIIVLAEGSENYLTDGDYYIFAYADYYEPSAAVFSKSDLTINGSGSLTVNAAYNNGIQSNDDLKIAGGSITVNAVNDAIRGRDSVVVMEADMVINAGADGIQSNNDEDAGKGYVSIESGTIDITADKDGIQAETVVLIAGGDINIVTGGGSADVVFNTGMMGGDLGGRGMFQGTDSSATTAEADTASTRGIKSGSNITITGGNINIDSADDALNTNDSLTINGGNITIASGDDAMHADSTLEINGGDIDITKCYEGIESAVVTVNGGSIHLVSSDDGFSISDGSGGEFMMGGGGPGQGEASVDIDKFLYINGGYIVVNSSGDGLDVNGALYMTGGTVIVHGPTNDGNGPMDYMGTCQVTGGLLIAAGSSGMAQAPDNSSTRYSIMVNFTESQPAGTLFHVESAQGVQILTFLPEKSYQAVVLCSPDLKDGSTYVVYTGGSSTGTNVDGLYINGSYTPGTEYASLTISGMTTVSGQSGGFGGNMGGMNGGGMRNNRDWNFPGMPPEGELPQMPEGGFPGNPNGDMQPPDMEG